MRPRTQIAIPEPSGSEFENFDRMVGILAKVKPNAPKKKKGALKKQTKDKPKA
jgi:hypothetical protein